MKSFGSRPGFFRIGVTAAILRDEGTVPEMREEWIMSVMRGDREGREVLIRGVGRGSSFLK